MKVLVYRFACIIIGFIFSLSLLAQSQKDFIPPSLDKKDTYTVKLKKDRDYPDMRTAYIEGELEGGSIQLLVEDLDILQPVILSVVADNPDEPIDVQLLKDNWDNVVREESNIDKVYETQFRTHKKFGIRINSATPDAKFHLATFVGQSQKISSDAFFYPASKNQNTNSNSKKSPVSNSPQDVQSESNESSSGGSMIYIIAFLLFAILIVLILLFMRKNKHSNTMGVILIFLLGAQVAQAGIRTMSGLDWGSFSDATGVDVTNNAKAYNTAFKLLNNVFSNQDKFKVLSPSDHGYVPQIDSRDIPSLPSSCYSATDSSGDFLGGGNKRKPKPPSRRDRDYPRNPDKPPLSDPSNDKPPSDYKPPYNDNYKPPQNNDKPPSDYKPPLDNEKKAPRYKQPQNNKPPSDVKLSDDKDKLPSSHKSSDHANGNDKSERSKAYEPEENGDSKKDPDEYDSDKNEEPTSRDPNAYDPNKYEEPTSRDPNEYDPNKYDNEQEELESQEQTGQNEGCQCLREAYEDFYNNYYKLEKLRIIYTTTMKDTKAAISFGDNFSGVHAVSGLAWQTERRKIMKSVKKFQQTYDERYQGITDRTYVILQRIAQCERMFGNNDWYRQSGFMYFQFVKMRYKRND